MTVPEVIDLLTRGGPVAIFAVILITGFFGYWVFGRTYNEMREDRNAWKEIAQDAVRQNEQLTNILESSKRGR
jgi:hypothetical protein